MVLGNESRAASYVNQTYLTKATLANHFQYFISVTDMVVDDFVVAAVIIIEAAIQRRSQFGIYFAGF